MAEQNRNTDSPESPTPEARCIDPTHLALEAFDTASLAQCYITDLHDIFRALAVLTEGNVEANGLARVGDSLAERYGVAFDGITHRLQAVLDALKGGAQ